MTATELIEQLTTMIKAGTIKPDAELLYRSTEYRQPNVWHDIDTVKVDDEGFAILDSY